MTVEVYSLDPLQYTNYNQSLGSCYLKWQYEQVSLSLTEHRPLTPSLTNYD